MDAKLTPEHEATYRTTMLTLNAAGIPYLVSGAFATYYYTGYWRNTKDFDIFLEPEYRDPALRALSDAGFATEVTVEHWLAKAFRDDLMIDVITGFGNWLHPVDESWLAEAEQATVLGIETKVIAVADLIWPKAYVAGRERFDGADICHLIRRAGDRINWPRLINHFGGHWELLLSYLHLYRFVYPNARQMVPGWVMRQLHERSEANALNPEKPDHDFRGPLLDRFSYLVDINEWGEVDPREEVARSRQFSISDVEVSRAADLALHVSGEADHTTNPDGR